MKKQAVTRALTIYILISLQGCATRAPVTDAAQITEAEIPPPDPALDHYIAWVPRNGARTPAVAMAQTHISMGYAKEQVARKLCGNSMLLDESVAEHVGPLAMIAPESVGGYPAWYYRVSLLPGLHGCGRISSPRLYLAIKDNLPSWIRLEMAATATPGTAKLFE